MQSISLVFPMYNEIYYLLKATGEARAVLSEITSDYEIIIVDDASTDGSGHMADEISKADDRVRVIHHLKNRKLGGALKTGFSCATKNIIVYADMDLPFELTVLKEIIPLMSGFDIIKGYRTTGRESLLRQLYSTVYNFLVNLVFNLKMRDVNFAMKIFKKDVVDNIRLKSEGSFISAEFLSKAKRFGYSIKEIGVRYKIRNYGISKLHSPAVIFKILYEMARYYGEIKFFSRRKTIYARLKVLYDKVNFRARIYNYIRFMTSPFETIESFVPRDGVIIDLGCGTGLFLNMLKLNANSSRTLIGYDIDARKLNIANKSSDGRGIKFNEADIMAEDFNLQSTKCITLIDVLCYHNYIQKKQLLRKCFNALDPRGTLIIKDINGTISLKFLFLFVQEFLIVKFFRLTSAHQLYFNTRNEFISLLKESGFFVEVFDVGKRSLYPHSLYVGKKQ